MPAEKQKLKPCPFCGSKDVGIYGNETDHYYVACMNPVCFCKLGEMYLPCDEPDHMFGDEESAAYNWNQRADIKVKNFTAPNTRSPKRAKPRIGRA